MNVRELAALKSDASIALMNIRPHAPTMVGRIETYIRALEREAGLRVADAQPLREKSD